MTTQDQTEPLKVGTKVRIRGSDLGLAQIVDYLGRIDPDKVRAYELYVDEDISLPVWEDQIEVVPEPK